MRRIAAVFAVVFAANGLIAAAGAAAEGVSSIQRPTIVGTAPGVLVPFDAPTGAPPGAPRPPRPMAAAAPRVQTATFSVTWTGFPANAQAAVQAAFDIWAGLITTNHVINVNATWKAMSTGLLGQGGPATFYKLSDGRFYPAALGEKICDCEGSNPVEILIDLSSSFPSWYFGTDGNPPATLVDLETAALHEIGHALGFLGSMTVNGTLGSWGFLGGDGLLHITNYDLFQVNATGQQLSDTSLFPNPSAALKTQLTGGNVFWDGAEGMAANGGVRPELWAPSTWAQGGSNVHLDEAAYPTGSVNALMTPTIFAGEAVHDPGPIVMGMLTDIGWTSPPPPVTIAIADLSKFEGATGTTKTMQFAVSLSSAAATDVSVTYSTSNGTATAGSDYVAKSNKTLTIAAGATAGTIKVSVTGDATVEPNETFFVKLSNPTGGATIADGTAKGTIKNDD